MNYLYDSKYRILRPITDKPTSDVYLSELEGKLVEVLSNNKTNSWYEIADYLYKENRKDRSSNKDRECVKAVKFKLDLKVKLNMHLVYGYGLMLHDRIYIK